MQDNSDQIMNEEESIHEEADVNTEVEETEVEAESEGDESEESEEVKPKKAGYVEIKDPAVKARVDQLSREKHENERKYKAEKAQREAIARELEELKRPPAPKEVPVPTADPVTEPDLFARQQNERDRYIRESTKYETETESRQLAQKQSEVKRQTALVEGYNSNIERLGLNPQVVAKAANYCLSNGLSNDHPLIEDLLEDKDGPAIVKFLHDNPEHLFEIVSLKPTKALAYIEKEIRAKLNIKQQSKAPPPPTKAKGARTSGNSSSGWTFS